MYIEEHNHCFMLYFGVKILFETPFPSPLMHPGYGARQMYDGQPRVAMRCTDLSLFLRGYNLTSAQDIFVVAPLGLEPSFTVELIVTETPTSEVAEDRLLELRESVKKCPRRSLYSYVV